MRVSHLVPALALLSALTAQQGADAVTDVRTRQTAPQQRDEVAAPATTASSGSLTNSSDVTPIHTMAADPAGGEYGTWASGAKYKVSFHGDMTFIPVLGSEYPTNQPLSWRTSSVRGGSKELLGSGENPARLQEPYRYSYAYQRFTEIYEVRSEGVEQSFLIHDPVAGDLVIEGQVTTALRGESVNGAHEEIRFFDDQQRLITTYGKAWAIDALGRKTAVTSTFADSRIRLTVNGSWLATAKFPVLVDPIVTPTRLVFGSLRTSADVCRDDSANDRMLVYIRYVSASDRDAYARIMEDDYSTNTTVFTDVTTSWSNAQIRAACADSPQKYAVVFDRIFSGGDRGVRMHVHDSGDLTLSTTYSGVAWSSGTLSWRPDVGGTLLGSAGNEVLVVYQFENATNNTATSEIRGVVVDISGTSPSVGTPFNITSASTSLDRERPAVNKQAAAGSPTVWMTVYQEYNAAITGDDWDAIGRLVDAAGSVSSNSWFPKNRATSGFHALGPVVAGASGRYCVAYAPGDQTIINFKTSLTNGTEIVVERVDWSSLAGMPTKFDERTVWGPHTDRRWVVGDIGYDSDSDSHWAVTSLSDTDYNGTGNVYIDRVGYNGVRLDTATLYSAPLDHNGDHGGVVFDDDNDEWAAVWIQNDTTASPSTAGAAHEVYGTSYSYDAVAAPVLSGTSCSSATLSWRPTGFAAGQQIGSEFTYVRVSGLPAGAVSFIGVSLNPANTIIPTPPVASGCRLLISNTTGWLGWFPVVIGSTATGDLALPEWLPSMTLYFQDWYIDPSNSMVYSTRRLEVPIVK